MILDIEVFYPMFDYIRSFVLTRSSKYKKKKQYAGRKNVRPHLGKCLTVIH